MLSPPLVWRQAGQAIRHSEKLAFKSTLHSVYSSLNYFFPSNTYSWARRPNTGPNYFLSFSLLTTGITFAILQPCPHRESLVSHSVQGTCWLLGTHPAVSWGPQSRGTGCLPPCHPPEQMAGHKCGDNNTFCSLGQSVVCTDWLH